MDETKVAIEDLNHDKGEANVDGGGLGFEDSRKAHTDELTEGCLQDFGYGWSRGSGCDAG